MKFFLAFFFIICINPCVFAQVPSYVDTTGLLTWYAFDSNLNNSYGAPMNNGAVYGDVSYSTDRFGVANHCYKGDGHSLMNIPVYDFPLGNAGRSACIYFKLDSAYGGAGKAFISWGANTLGERFGVFNTDTMIGLEYVNGYVTTHYIPDTLWHDLVITYPTGGTGSSSVKIYLDGLLKPSSYIHLPVTSFSTDTGAWHCLGGSIYFGTAFTDSWNGRLDEGGVWNRAITPCEVSYLYYGGNHSLAFAGGHVQTLSLCGSSAAVPINSLLAVNDSDIGITNTWSIFLAPSHGTLTGAYSTTTTGFTTIPTGFSYTPTAGYTGPDSFKVIVHDCGNATDTTTIHVTVNPAPAAISGSTAIAVAATTTLSDATTGGTWSSSNTGISTVTSGGVVTGVAAGTAMITYTLSSGCTVTALITVGTLIPTPNMIITIAGDGGAGYTGDGIEATASELNQPNGVAVDGSGNIYISEYGGERIRKVNTSGIISTIAGNGTYGFAGDGGPATASEIRRPCDVTTDAAGNIYITDQINSRVREINSSGIINTIAGSATFGFAGDGGPATSAALAHPFAAALDAAGNIYIADYSNNRIRKVNTSGTITTIAGSTVGGFSGDGGAAVGAQFNEPAGVAVDAAGNVYIADVYNNRIRKVNTAGIITTFAGSGATGSGTGSFSGDGGPAVAAHLNQPVGIAMDAWGNIFVGDAGNNRIRKIDVTGTITTIAGNGSEGFSGDECAATAAELNYPTYIAVDDSEYIYVVDGSNRIRKIIYDRRPFFTEGHSDSMTVCGNSIADSINSLLAVMDSDNLQGEVWSVVTAPVHGTTTAAYTTISTGDTLTPTGLFYTPITGYTGSDSFKVLVTDCVGMFDTTTIHVNILPPPPSAITGAFTVCSGSTGGLYDSVSGGIWSSSNTSVATIGSSSGVVKGVTAGTTIITYTIAASCSITMATTVVTVNSFPTSITGTALICGGATTALSDAATGGTWNSSNASVASVNITSGLITGGSVSAVSTATITYTTTGGCGASMMVTVNPQPGAITGAGSLCAGATVILTSGPSGGSWSSSNTAVATIATTGIAGGAAGGTATIAYTLPAGCNAIFPVAVAPQPFPITGTTSLCIGTTITLIDATTGGAWTSSNTAIAAIDPLSGVLLAGLATGTSTISYTSGSGCAATTIVTVSIGPLFISGTLALCGRATTGLSDGVGGGAWSSGSMGVATVDSAGSPSTGIVYGVSAGTATISYSIGTCIVAATVTVNAAPPAISGVTEVCVGLATLLSDATTGGTWSSSSAAVASIVSASGILTGGAAGTATISYTLPDGCAVTTTETVNTTPSAITGNLYVCPGATTLLSDPAAGGTGSGGGSWSSGNTAVATVGSTGAVVGGAVGTASIIYSIGAGCFTSTVVTVNPLPPAISGTAILCAGSTTTLSDGTGTWSSSNTSVATIGSASGVAGGVAGGTATVTYTSILTGCIAIRAVTINPLPLAITGTLTVCAGVTTSLNDLTTGGNWSSGTPAIATISSTGVVAGLAPGTSVITYTNPATGCSRTAVVTVNPLPAVPSIAGTLSICGDATTTLTDATTGGLWSSTGSIATVTTTSGVVRGVSAGTAVIYYTLASGCARTAVVTINPLPAAIIGPTAECVGATIMEDESLAGGFWTSSVPAVATIGTAGNVTGVATGTTVITYTSLAGCKATTTITVSLSPTGVIGGSNVCATDTTTLSDAIAGGVWSSSNTAAATVGSLNAIVTGVAAGTTIITYSLGTGCTVTRIMTVNAAPDGITGTASLCIGATTMLADASTGGTWSSSAAGIATVTSTGVVTGGAPGIDTIIYTQGGCAVTTTVTVNLTPLAITGTGSVCAGDSIALSDAVSGGVWTSSNTGIAEVSAGVGAGLAVVAGMAPGTATIAYSLGSTGSLLAGCAVTKIITVNPISPISGSMGMCLGATTTLSDATTGGTWSRGTSTVVSVSTTGVVSGLLAGTSAITYTTAAGCEATAVVTVNLAPSAISGTLHVCAGATTALGNTAGGGVWTSGNTGVAMVGSTGTVSGIVAGTATITYSLGSGCTVAAVVTVNAMPSGITGMMSMCAGTTTALVETSTGGLWSSGSTATATVSSTGIVSGVSGGTVTVSYGYATGCTATATVTVNPLPALIVGTTHLCAGLTTTLTSATTGGSWGSSNTAIAATDPASGVVTGLSPGTSVISYNLPSGCSTSITVTINAAPTAITGSLAVCIGSGTTLGDSSGTGIWSSSNTVVATVSPTGIVSGVALGTSMISYTAGGCPATAVVTINSLPGAIGSTRLCLGATETLTDLPDGGTWSSSDAAVAAMSAGGAVTGVSAGTATIAYSLGAGCTVMATITVEALPGAITGVPQVCLGYVTTLIDAAGDGAWSSSNTAIATVSGTGAVNGISGGPVMISYTSISTGCAATRLVTVVAVPAITGVSDMCAFSAVMDVVDSLAGGTWTSTSVTVSTAGVVTPYAAGAASLTYTIPLGCYTTTSFTVHPLPGPVTGDFHFCVGLSAVLGDTTSGGVWHSSNTAIASINTAGVVRGLAGGTATISYVLPTGCMETEIITVDSIPVAGSISGLPVVCVGAVITLSDLLAGGVWSSSNTSADVSGGIVSGISAGVDTIRYEVSNSCGSATTTKTIVVNPLPEAGAITGPAIVCVEDSVVLADAVPGGTWSSSVSATATIAGGILRGLRTGADTIRYSVTNSCGTAVAVRIVTVNTLPDAGTISLIDTICTGFTYLLTDSIPGGAWSANNSVISVSAAGLISALSAGVDTITYSLTNMCGTASASAAIAVKAMSAPNTITGDTYVCEGGTDTLTVTPQGGVWGSSNGNVTITPTASGASIFGVLPGADTITYTMPGECSAAGGIYPITVLSVNQCDSNTGASPQPSPKEREVLRVWPNPNDGTFSMLLSSAIDEGVEILITNVIGEKVREASTVTNRITEIKLNEAEGVYFINASSSGGSYEAKVVVGK